jgi:DNA repair exonuclease SbcCD ATPase subunit
MLGVIAGLGEGETLDEIDDLFALPLDEFTAARNALAKRLKQDGDADAAEQVRALPKPSVAAWAVNQLARREPEAVRSLLNVASRLRSAQERSFKGERAADELRAAQAEEREIIRDLARAAESLLQSAGRPASGTTLERVSSLLRAAAVSDSSALREGRLTGDVEAAGFDAFAGLAAPAKGRGRRGAPAGDDLAERRRRKRELEQQRKRLERRVRELEAKAEAAERDAERARKAADQAEAHATDLRRRTDEAAAELAELES